MFTSIDSLQSSRYFEDYLQTGAALCYDYILNI